MLRFLVFTSIYTYRLSYAKPQRWSACRRFNMVSEGARNDCFRGGLDQGRGGQNFDGVASGDDAGQAGQDALDRGRSAGECCEVGRLAARYGFRAVAGDDSAERQGNLVRRSASGSKL